MARGERIVDDVLAERLVPPALLEQVIHALGEHEGVTARVVAEEFDVPILVADRALCRRVAGF